MTRRRSIGLVALIVFVGAAVGVVVAGRDDGAPSIVRQIACTLGREQVAELERGWHEERSGDLFLVADPSVFLGNNPLSAADAGSPQGHVPLVFYAPKRLPATEPVDRLVHLADVGPTIAGLLRGTVNLPQGGTALPEVATISGRSLKQPPPRLVVTVVWQGGGWNVLEKWPGNPTNLLRMMESGISFERARTGSAPVTQVSSLATLTTGLFPRDHGITDELVRAEDGLADVQVNEVIGRPRLLLIRTIQQRWTTASPQARAAELESELDDLGSVWKNGFGRDEVPDLLTVSVPSIASAAREEGSDSQAVNDALLENDTQLGRFERELDRRVGKGRWVLIVTADRGLQPDPADVPRVQVDPIVLTSWIEENTAAAVEAITGPQLFLQDPADAAELARALGDVTFEDLEIAERDLLGLVEPGDRVFSAALPADAATRRLLGRAGDLTCEEAMEALDHASAAAAPRRR